MCPCDHFIIPWKKKHHQFWNCPEKANEIGWDWIILFVSFFVVAQFNIQRRSDAEAQLGSSPNETTALEFETKSFDKGRPKDQTPIPP